MRRADRLLTLTTAAGGGIGLIIFSVLASGGAGHAGALSTRPAPAVIALQARAPALPAPGASEAQPTVAQDYSGPVVGVVYPHAQR